MNRCFHIDPSGRRCDGVAAEGSNFCLQHHAESVRPAQLRQWGFRLAALVLLLLVLLDLYVSLKSALR